MKAYLSASSAELPRARVARDALRELGMVVVGCEWIDSVAAHGSLGLGKLDALVSKRAREIAEHCGPFASPHEIYGVLAEELDELFEVVKQRDSMRSTTKLIRELVDIAAASLRAANQLAASLDHEITEAEVRNA